MVRIRGFKCECGKTYTFTTKQEADDFIGTKAAPPGLTRSYECPIFEDTWHVTSQAAKTKEDSLKVLERQLHREMSVISNAIEKYMWNKYEQEGISKFSSSEIRELLKGKKLVDSDSQMYNAIAALKRNNQLVVLDEKVNNKTNAKYMTLTRILEEETKPKPKPEESEPESKSKEVHVQHKPKPLPTVPVANPFDKVFSELGEIKAKINGLAQGYSEIAKRESTSVSDTTGINTDVKVALADLIAPMQDSLKVVVERFLDNSPVPQNTEDVVNKLLNNFGEQLLGHIRREIFTGTAAISDSFLRPMKTEIDVMQTGVSSIMNMISTMPLPETVVNSEDYKQGIREGIRMAVEMGITQVK